MMGTADTTKRAWCVWFVAPRKVSIQEADITPPKAGQLQVQSLFSAISHGTEMLAYRGEISRELKPSLPTIEGDFTFPIKYGYANVGKVVGKGEGIRRFEVGDTVFALAPHQTLYNVTEDLAWRLPDALAPEHAVFAASMETALGIMHDSPVQLGDTVVIFGLGVIGSLALQLVILSGAQQVIAVEPLEYRRRMALRLGADICIPPTREDVAHAIDSLTKGLGADVVIEASGSPGALDLAIKAAGVEATVVVASWYGIKSVQLNLGGDFHRNRIKIVSAQVSRINPVLSTRWTKDRRMDLALELLKKVDVASLVSGMVPFRQAPQAYETLDGGSEEVIQIILDYGEA